MPNNQLVLNQIRALAPNAPKGQKITKENFKPKDAMEAACLALAMKQEESDPTMNGLVEISINAMLAEREKNNALVNAVNALNNRMDDMEGGDETVTVVLKPKAKKQLAKRK